MLTVEGAAPTGPEELLHHLLERFPAEREFWDTLRSEYTVKLSIGLFQETWNRGLTLEPQTVALVALTGALIDFDIYCDGEDCE